MKTLQKHLQLESNSNLPRYKRIEKELKRLIDSGIIKQGEKLPSEKEISDICQASRVTVRQALKQLESNNIIFCVPGKGSFAGNRSWGAELQKNIPKSILVYMRSNQTRFHPYSMMFIEGVERQAGMFGYSVVFCSDLRNISCDQVLGVIFAERIPLETLTELENKKIPFVITKEHFETYKRDFPSVCLASREAVYEQTIYLIRLGHKKIALFTGILNNGINGEGSRKMLSGYKQALEENNIAFDSSLVKESGYDTELTRKQTATLLKMAERPTAVIAADDIGAGIIINVMRENNIIVPKDISVMGTGDLDFLVAISPALTSYHIPVKEIGERAFSLLYQIIKNEKCEYPIYIQGNVITRASCAPPKM